MRFKNLKVKIMKENRMKKFDWLMLLLVVPFALFGALVLWVGAKDIDRIEEARAKNDSIRGEISRIDSMSRRLEDSIRRELKTLEDSIHEFEDGM